VRKLQKRHWFIFLSFWLIGLAAACSQDQEPDSSLSSSPTAGATSQEIDTIDPVAEETGTPAGDVQPAEEISTPDVQETEETPIPVVSASQQVLGDEGKLTIDKVFSIQDGWIVVYNDDDGIKGELLGYSAVDGGPSEEIEIAINPLRAGDALYVVLHSDSGEVGTFEFPGPDQPVEYKLEPVEDHFRINNRATIPELVVSDQLVLEDGIVIVDYVAATRKGWLAIHFDEGGQPGEMAAYLPVKAGVNENLAMPINWRAATPSLHAVLYEDAGEQENFEDATIDQPVRLEGTQVATAFEATFPPDVFIVQQPIVDGSVVVDRAISYGPGWLVIYFDDEGRLGNIIGQAPLEHGINEQIVVDVVESAATSFLHVMLHQDTEGIGEFEFPRADPMVTHQGSVPNPITFRIDAGNYLITHDQPLSASNTVTISQVVLEEDSWIVIYNDVEGEFGEMLGLTWLPAGLHRDVTVDIDPETTTTLLHAVLHIDAGREKEFEYPDNPDVPLRRNSNVIDSPFVLISE
jgi:hypothetical protein